MRTSQNNHKIETPTFQKYSKGAFLNALKSAKCPASVIRAKEQFKYISSYLIRLGCRSLLVESTYTDNDYLNDFSEYYVKCATADYKKQTKRIHFFSTSINAAFLEMLFKESNPEIRNKMIGELLNEYIGFIVVKDLPHAIFGRTVLKHYPKDDSSIGLGSDFRRFFPCLECYKASLYGIPLEIESLAFQEQDTTVAACATTALWSCFHGISEKFDSTRPSPSKITKLATNYLQVNRPFPTEGLSIEQMCHALIEIGLAPESQEIRPDIPIISMIYAYLKASIPVLLIVNIDNPPDLKSPDDDLHAVCVVGYREENLKGKWLKQEMQIIREDKRVLNLDLWGKRICELYAHDDNCGPYTRLKVEQLNAEDGSAKEKELHPIYFSNILDASNKTELYYPVSLLIPLNDMIRIKFRAIYYQAYIFRSLIEACQLNRWPAKLMEWEIYLSSLNDYKKEVLSYAPIDRYDAKNFLLSDQSKYLWVCRIRRKNEIIFDLIADATNTERAWLFTNMLFASEEFEYSICNMLSIRNETINAIIDNSPGGLLEFLEKIIARFNAEQKEKEEDHALKVTQKFQL